ncbi:olfactory receptor 2M5-like [Ursus arctos]|uniref:olfactory receptor 2M5-like n=1 Tax=Ursus arctos TaxID=9644 RepID=UPI002546B160|nr:olfactory receptor 2M5-like [Ursus arctos]
MRSGNETETTDFILLGFFPEFKHITAMVSIILLIYMAAFTGNTLLILLIWLYSHLHTPMYFLLSQLSLMDLTLTSSIVPKMAANFFSGWRSISFLACGTQIFFSLTVAIAECILISFMCFDRYVAICDPLRYPGIINPRVCLQMIAMSWAGGALTSLVHTAFTLHFNICSPREIPHFFCEVMTGLRIVCEDISVYWEAVVITSIIVLLLPLSLILSSYVVIFLAVLRMNSPEGRNKALATCSSHLCVVGLYFGPGICIYMRPGSANTPKLNQGLFLFGTVLTPLLNSLAYSLRNKEVISALKKLMGRWRCQSSSCVNNIKHGPFRIPRGMAEESLKLSQNTTSLKNKNYLSLTDLLQWPGEKEHLDAVGPCHGFCAGYTLLACVDHYPGCITPFALYSGFLLYLICERHLQIRGKREEFRVVMAMLQPGWA